MTGMSALPRLCYSIVSHERMPDVSKPRKIEGTMAYSPDDVQPEDLLTFIELPGFDDDWKRLRLNDDDLWMLQFGIMVEPRGAPVMSGTDGLRKLRFAPSRWGTGKRGAARVGYVYFEEFGIVLLVVAYAKNEQDDLSSDDKRIIRDMIRREREALERRPYH